jgi:uncharacterized protein (TIGR00299 family) protein
MKVAWFDGSAGASGDMLLGALVDSAVPLEVPQEALDMLDLGIALRREPVHRHGLAATKIHVDVPEPRVLRHLSDVFELFEVLPPTLAETAGAVFRRLAEAEAAVHRMSVEEVHFHEVGALDCIADVVGVVAGAGHLGAERMLCSTLSLGSGQSRTEHGVIPVPVPAVLELLAGVASARAGRARFESTTPTGAALLVTLIEEWGPMPELTIGSVGMGAGTRDAAEVANVLRVVVGEAAVSQTIGVVTTELQIEANVDDLDPRVWPSAIAAVLSAGASDAWVTPITMKKGRPAFTLGVLCTIDRAVEVRDEVFRQTSTIGLREFAVTKRALAREEGAVEIDGHRIRVKTASSGETVTNRSVEWDDVVAAATDLGRSPKDVLAEASRRAQELGAR